MRDLSESHIAEAFLKNIWMRRLPSHVQVVLAVSSESLSKLAEMSDKIIEFSPDAVNSVSDSTFSSCHASQRDEQLLKMQKQIDELHRLLRSGSRHTSPNRIAIEVHQELVLKNAKIGNAGTILDLKRKQNFAYRLVHLNKKHAIHLQEQRRLLF
ncbi:hypothetical protein AVEN_254453-1 [Araneus ventricosus]|uniref:Uncharacterized protein n=1 Tax=Araneus ventricosus TaxID=182803 RepID=A0A4Y2PZS1_ARAVE|nr:hypothetical protein AVEN_254453-1 [Araneus ventricosus]